MTHQEPEIRTVVIPEWARFATPPECQGQIIEQSYGQVEDGEVLCRSEDRSCLPGDPDRVTWSVATLTDADEADWQPWNREPSIVGGWDRCQVRYLRDEESAS